eukprot:SM000158S02011  [mRNA]  locus=s158:113666:115076:+ [translate_table: standard]
MLSRVAASLRQLAGRLSPRGELVGRDAAGNQYFRAPRALDGGAGELRLLDLQPSATTVATCSSGDGVEPSQRAAHGGPRHALRVSSKEELDADVASPASCTPAEGERRWVQFKERIPDPRSLPVEWASWLACTRASAPTQQVQLSLTSVMLLDGDCCACLGCARQARLPSLGRNVSQFLVQLSCVLKLLLQGWWSSMTYYCSEDDYLQVPKVEERHPASANLWIGLNPPSNMPSSHLCMLQHGGDRAPTSKSTLYRILYRQSLLL